MLRDVGRPQSVEGFPGRRLQRLSDPDGRVPPDVPIIDEICCRGDDQSAFDVHG